jgi:acyl-CoA thioesterase FadM
MSDPGPVPDRPAPGAPRRDPDPSLPMFHAAEYRVRFDEATPRAQLRSSVLMGFAIDVAWRHSDALGFPRDWYRERGVTWLAKAVEARILGPMADGEALTLSTRLTGFRRVMARRRTEVTAADGTPRAVVVIDWAMTDGRVPVRIPLEFERAPIDGPGSFAPIRVELPAAPPDATTLRLSPRLRELDPLDHVNSGVYFDWLDEAVAAAGPAGEAAIAGIPRTYRLEYLRPAALGVALVSTAWLERAGDDGGPAGWAYRLADEEGADLLRGRLDPA